MAKKANITILFAILIFIITTQHNNTHRQTSMTFVTALFDIHGDTSADRPRSFQYYLNFFQKVLSLDINLIIFGDEVVKQFVWSHRKSENTHFIDMSVQKIHNKWYSERVDEVRRERLTWPFFTKNNHILFSLKDYNTLVLSKFQFLSQAVMEDPFHSQYFYWLDGGFFHVEVYEEIFPQNSIVKFMDLLQPVWVFHAYQTWPNRFFGYKTQFQKQYLDRKLDRFDEQLRGNFVGGLKDVIMDNKCAFTNLLNMHLHNNDLNSQEGIWTLMQMRYPYLSANNFAGPFNFHNHTITNKQNSFKNQQTQRHFHLKTIGRFTSISHNIIKHNQYNFKNVRKQIYVMQGRIADNDIGRIQKLRALVALYERMLHKRRYFLVILIIFGISMLIFTRKVQQKHKNSIQNEYNSFLFSKQFQQKAEVIS